MSFDRPDLLWLALLAPAELALALWRTPRLERSLAKLAGPARAVDAAALHRAASIIGAAFSVLFIIAAVLSLAGPAWGSRAVSAERSGLEIALVLDVSRSMMVTETGLMQGRTRLDAAREILRGLLRVSPDAAFSLVATKGSSVLLVPMTDDLEAIDSGLDYGSPETLSAAGTDLESGLMAGLDSFTGKSGANRILILLSDGGEHGSDSGHAALEARRRGVRIMSLGFGGPDAFPVPGPTGTPVLDSHGLAIRSGLQAAPLKAAATVSGGRYFEATDAAARAFLRAELTELGKGGKRTEYEVQDRTGIFALLALAFLAGRILASLASMPRATR